MFYQDHSGCCGVENRLYVGKGAKGETSREASVRTEAGGESDLDQTREAVCPLSSLFPDFSSSPPSLPSLPLLFSLLSLLSLLFLSVRTRTCACVHTQTQENGSLIVGSEKYRDEPNAFRRAFWDCHSRLIGSWPAFHLYPLPLPWINLNLIQNIIPFRHKYFSMSRCISKVELTRIVAR